MYLAKPRVIYALRGRRLVVRPIACVLLAGVLFGGYALLARFVLHGPVNARSLYVSVASASGSAAVVLDTRRGCRRTGAPGAWRCEVSDG